MAVARSTDGGVSFGAPGRCAGFTRYFPFDGAATAATAPYFCGAPGFVFHRVPLEPRVTADQTGELPGVYATFNAIDPATIVAEHVAVLLGRHRARRAVGGLRQPVDQQRRTWGGPGQGRQRRWPRVTSTSATSTPIDGRLMAVWQDNRTDDDYSVQLPIGNTPRRPRPGAQSVGDRRGRHVRRGVDQRHRRSPRSA